MPKILVYYYIVKKRYPIAWISFFWNSGAQEKTRTSTPLLAHGPEPCASTNSATWASFTTLSAVSHIREVVHYIFSRAIVKGIVFMDWLRLIIKVKFVQLNNTYKITRHLVNYLNRMLN